MSAPPRKNWIEIGMLCLMVRGKQKRAANKRWLTRLLVKIGRYFRLREDEVDSLNEDRKLPLLSSMTRKGENIYFAGIDMLHSLHCLNEIRKHLETDFTDHTMDFPELKQLHLGEYMSTNV